MSTANAPERRLTRDEELTRLVIPWLAESNAATKDAAAAESLLAALKPDDCISHLIAIAAKEKSAGAARMKEAWLFSAEHLYLAEAIRVASARASAAERPTREFPR